MSNKHDAVSLDGVDLDSLSAGVAEICLLVDRLREHRQELLNLAHEAVVMVEDLDNDGARQWVRAAAETLAWIEDHD